VANNQPVLNATEGATALNIDPVVAQNNGVAESEIKIEKEENILHEPLLDNISMENAEYLQNSENTSASNNTNENSEMTKFDENQSKEDIPTFEVDSIELTTPDLFSNNENLENEFNQDTNNNEKEPEMFDQNDKEEDFEIPAFLRKQKN